MTIPLATRGVICPPTTVVVVGDAVLIDGIIGGILDVDEVVFVGTIEEIDEIFAVIDEEGGVAQAKPGVLTNQIIIVRNAHKTIRVAVTDKDGGIVSLVGATIFFAVKETIDSQEELIEKSSVTVAEIEVIDAAGGIYDIHLVPVDTKPLTLQTYKWDSWVRLANGKQHPVIKTADFKVASNIALI